MNLLSPSTCFAIVIAIPVWALSIFVHEKHTSHIDCLHFITILHDEVRSTFFLNGVAFRQDNFWPVRQRVIVGFLEALTLL